MPNIEVGRGVVKETPGSSASRPPLVSPFPGILLPALQPPVRLAARKEAGYACTRLPSCGLWREPRPPSVHRVAFLTGPSTGPGSHC